MKTDKQQEADKQGESCIELREKALNMARSEMNKGYHDYHAEVIRRAEMYYNFLTHNHNII